ncbi:MAG: hypothetical protein JWM19_1788 [Actinomycetia bacterium]|nr:hypothetical protein [Actinomycetes bacterium]
MLFASTLAQVMTAAAAVLAAIPPFAAYLRSRRPHGDDKLAGASRSTRSRPRSELAGASRSAGPPSGARTTAAPTAPAAPEEATPASPARHATVT